ncbi:unnamed protein product, partial [Closterium sp. NIES-65]
MRLDFYPVLFAATSWGGARSLDALRFPHSRSRARWFRSGRAMVMPDNGDGLRTAMERSERSKRSCPTGADSVLVGMWHDLPETPRQEEQLRRAKVAAEAASDAKSIVLRNMRHEICTPMHAPNSPRWRGEARQANNPVLLVPLTRSLPFPSPFHLLPVCRFGLPFTSPSSPLTLPFLCLLLPISPPLSLPFSSLSPPISLRFPSSSVLLASPSPPFSIPFPSLSPPDPLPIPSRFPPIPIPVPSPSPPRSLPFPSPSSLITCTCIFSEQSKIDSQRPSALPRASRTFGSALSLKRSMYLQPETYRHAQEDKAPGTCIKEGPSGRAIRGCWVAGLLGCWEANSTGMLRQIIPHRVSNVIEFTHTVVTHQLLRCTPHVLLLLLHYSSILQTGPPARQGFQGTIMQIYPLCNNLKPLLRRLKSRLLCNNLKPLLSAEEKTSRGAKKQWSPSIVLANTSHKIRMV